MRRRVDISVDHIVPRHEVGERHVPQREMAGRGERGQQRRDDCRHDQRQHHDQLAIDGFGHGAGEGAEGELRQLAGRYDAGGGQRRAGDLVGKHTGDQKLQPAHGVSEAAHQPQPQEIRQPQQLPDRSIHCLQANVPGTHRSSTTWRRISLCCAAGGEASC
jgi:hypothetical protein